MDKQQARILLRHKLAMVDEGAIRVASHAVCEQLKSDFDWTTVRRLHVYRAELKWHELDIERFISWMAHAYPSVSVVVGPPEVYAVLPGGQFDMILLPLLGFDNMCRRLGRGRGWYDNFLSTQPGAIKVGVALESQRIDVIPMEQHDVPLDAIVTERTVYRGRITTSAV